MISLVANDITLAILSQARELAEVRDANGTVVGFFTPVTVRKGRTWVVAADHVDTVSLVNGQWAHELSYTTRQVFERILARAPDERGKAGLQQHIDRLRDEEEGEELDPPLEADPHLEIDGRP